MLGRVLKAVFDVNIGSKYKDEVWRRYDIPNRRQADLVRGCIGDWVIFRRTGRRSAGAYFAVGRVERIEPDPDRSSFFFALIRDFLSFSTSVPMRPGGRHAETQFLSFTRTSQIGQFFQRNPIRSLWDADFDSIVRAGFSPITSIEPGDASVSHEQTGFEEQVVEAWMHEPGPRRVDEVLRHLPFRAASFRLNVGRAYGYMCAFTGLKLMDNHGHHETHAAHLLPVAEGGPDVVQNGICVNRTVHWALDQHLLSIDEANCPMVARNAELDAYLRQFPRYGKPIVLPSYASQYPDPAFLAHHRAAFLRKNRI